MTGDTSTEILPSAEKRSARTRELVAAAFVEYLTWVNDGDMATFLEWVRDEMSLGFSRDERLDMQKRLLRARAKDAEPVALHIERLDRGPNVVYDAYAVELSCGGGVYQVRVLRRRGGNETVAVGVRVIHGGVPRGERRLALETAARAAIL